MKHSRAAAVDAFEGFNKTVLSVCLGATEVNIDICGFTSHAPFTQRLFTQEELRRTMSAWLLTHICSTSPSPLLSPFCECLWPGAACFTSFSSSFLITDPDPTKLPSVYSPFIVFRYISMKSSLFRFYVLLCPLFSPISIFLLFTRSLSLLDAACIATDIP